MKVLDNYEILSILGKGTFGIVKLAQNKTTKEKVAIKVLEKKRIKDDEDKYRVKTEIEILQRMTHINVIKAKKILKDSENIYIIMEYCEKGELFNRIVKEIYLANDEAACYFYQLINGLDYIHQKGIVHRDLKLENILLSKNNILKIIDFGLSNFYDNSKLLSTPCGSPSYASPDILSGEKYDGIMIDIWSSGIILYAMLCGYLPFEDENNENLYQKILNCKFEIPVHLEEDSVDILKKILVKEPKKRITIKEIKNHKFYIKGKKEFFRSHPNIIKIIKNRMMKNVHNNEKKKEISIIKHRNRNNIIINNKLKVEENTNKNNRNNKIINNSLNNDNNYTIKLDEKNNITENENKNMSINNIFNRELMKNILKRKIKINCDSLLINSINLNINNDINQKSQKDRYSIYNHNSFVKSDYIKDIESNILNNVYYADYMGQRNMFPIYKNNKAIDNKDINNNNNNISNLKQNKKIFTNRNIQANNNLNKYSQNMKVKIQKSNFKNNSSAKVKEKKIFFMTVRNMTQINNKIEHDYPETEKLSKTSRYETKNSNLTKEKNNNINHKLTIKENEIKYIQKKSSLNNRPNPKKYYRKIISPDGNLNLKKNSMKYYDEIKTMNNTLSYSTENKMTNKIKIKKSGDYLNYVIKSNNNNQIKYKNSFNIRKLKNSPNKESNILSKNNKFDNINNDIIYTRIFNDDKNKKETDRNNILDNYIKQNMREKLKLKGFNNKKRRDYIFIENNDENNTINYNTNKKIRLINDMNKGRISSHMINLSKIKESKKINKMIHYLNSTNKNHSTKNEQNNPTKSEPKQYYKSNLNNNINKSTPQNYNGRNYKKHIKINLNNNINLYLINNNEKTNKNLEKKKYNKKFSEKNNNNNFIYLMNNMSKSLNDYNTNFNKDKTFDNYQGYYKMEKEYNFYNSKHFKLFKF